MGDSTVTNVPTIFQKSDRPGYFANFDWRQSSTGTAGQDIRGSHDCAEAAAQSEAEAKAEAKAKALAGATSKSKPQPSLSDRLFGR
jgi:hypothetical protein